MDFDVKPISLDLMAQLSSKSVSGLTPQEAFADLLSQSQSALNDATSTKEGRPVDDDARLKEACRQLEAVFLNMLAKEMRKTVPKGELIDGGRAEEFFTSMLDETLTAEASKNGGTQLAEMLYLQLRQTQEGGSDKEQK